jgi:hypothetical protein
LLPSSLKTVSELRATHLLLSRDNLRSFLLNFPTERIVRRKLILIFSLVSLTIMGAERALEEELLALA